MPARRALHWLVRISGGVALCAWLGWTALTILFSNLSSAGLRQGLTVGYVLWLVAALVLVRPRRRGLYLALGSSALVALAYVLVRPSNEREWQADLSVTPTIVFDGERVTVRGVRNFAYRSESDFDQRLSYWGPTDYCHTFLSFGFEGGEQLAVSVETRKEVGEEYSTLAGLFKRYELIYVFGDERDLIGLRTNHRGEHVYLYRLRAEPARLRELLLSYLHFADELARAPQFYGVLRNSCGVNILHRVAETGRTVLVGRDALLNGRWDQNLYEQGALSQELPFEELRRKSRIDERAKAAGEAPDFSRRIREGLPAAPPPPP
jgi:hypothetical protein